MCFIDTLRYIFQRDVAPATEDIFAPSELLMIYFVCGDFQLYFPVGYGYLRGAAFIFCHVKTKTFSWQHMLMYADDIR